MCHMTWLVFRWNASQHIWRSLWHDSFICVMFVTWLIYVWCSWNCHMTWLMFRWNASQHIWRSDSFICVFVTWLIYICDVCDMTYDMTQVLFECVAARRSTYEGVMFVTRLIHTGDNRDMTYDIRDMTHVSFECIAAHMKESNLWHDSFICVMFVTWLMIFATCSYVIWRICVRAWHFWFICVTWLIYLLHIIKSRRTWVRRVTYEWVMSHLNESCHICMSQVT